MSFKHVFTVLVMALGVLSGCSSTASNNTTYAQPQGLGPDATIGGDRSFGTGPGPDFID